MNDTPEAMRTCPTRVDSAPVLFAHAVTPNMCQQRQRDQYHKCFTCVHNNAQSDARRTSLEVLTRLQPLPKVSSAS